MLLLLGDCDLKYHFPIVIIDEDYHSENVVGLGVRDLARAIEALGEEGNLGR